MAEYQKDRRRSDAVLEDVRWVLSKACRWTTRIASDHLDIEQATDLIANKSLHVAVRSRSFDKYFEDYGEEFTVRSRRDSKAETELSKIRRGFGDYLFYGFCEGKQHRFWRIIDLSILRQSLRRLGPDAFGKEFTNNDGTYFYAFDVRLFEAMGIPIQFKWGAC
jgi:hypothetical protein